MTSRQNKLSRFWLELKRRKVFKVVAMYAGAAYIIVELVNNVAAPLRLPDWVALAVIIILIAGFPVVAILSWIFDLTPEGLKKTGPARSLNDELPEGAASRPVARKFRISDAVIIVLGAAVCVLLYPKIFNRDKLEDIRDEKGRITVAVMPFSNQTGDPGLNFWQTGISELIINDLGSSEELSVLSSQAIYDAFESMGQVNTASIAINPEQETARKTNAGVFITGSYQQTSDRSRIMVNLIEAEKGEVLWTTRIDGNLDSDFLDLSDSISSMIKNYLEIQAIEQKSGYDLRNAFPTSVDAYRNYIEGLKLMQDQEYILATESLEAAYNLDTCFSFAAFYNAWAYMRQNRWGKVRSWTVKALECQDRLPLKYQYLLETWRASYVTKNLDDIIKYCELLRREEFKSRLLLLDIATTHYSFTHDYETAAEILRQIESINTDLGQKWNWHDYYSLYGDVNRRLGRYAEANRIYDTGLELFPHDSTLLFFKCICSLSENDTIQAEMDFDHFLANIIPVENQKAYIERLRGLVYLRADMPEKTELHYRKAIEQDPENERYKMILAKCLIRYRLNIEEGAEILESVKQKSSFSSADMLWSEALVQFENGELEKALDDLLQVRRRWLSVNPVLEQDIKLVRQALAAQ